MICNAGSVCAVSGSSCHGLGSSAAESRWEQSSWAAQSRAKENKRTTGRKHGPGAGPCWSVSTDRALGTFVLDRTSVLRFSSRTNKTVSANSWGNADGEVHERELTWNLGEVQRQLKELEPPGGGQRAWHDEIDLAMQSGGFSLWDSNIHETPSLPAHGQSLLVQRNQREFYSKLNEKYFCTL